jgi:hypothetical protein
MGTPPPVVASFRVAATDTRYRGRPGRALGVLALLALLAAACGSSVPTTLRGSPSSYLISLDQLTSPDFTVYEAAAAVGAGWLDQASSSAVRADGMLRAAEVEYYRDVAFSTSNGPITLTAAVAAFATSVGASAAMVRLASALDARPGAVPVSTGTLGDGGHATSTQATFEGVGALQLIVVWRVDNLVNSLVAEGRLGGLQLDQLLPLASIQTANERAG